MCLSEAKGMDINMEYQSIGEPFEFKSFETLDKKQAEEYFQWYLKQIEGRIEQLERYIKFTNNDLVFDYSIESLIPLWKWYEAQIVMYQLTQEEFQEKLRGQPDWIKDYIDDKEISMQTLKIGMDIAIYFAKVFIKHNPSIRWGYFTKPKNMMYVNRPVLLGFVKGKVLDSRNIVVVATLKSDEERKPSRLYDLYYVWLGFIEKHNE